MDKTNYKLNEESTQLTLRQMIIFISFLLVIGNLSAIYSVYSPPEIISHMIIITVFCIAFGVAMLLMHYFKATKQLN